MNSFTAWLLQSSRHSMVQSLVIGDIYNTPEMRRSRCPVRWSLSPPAAASCPGWKLQQYISTSPDSSAPITLGELPRSHLTKLQIVLPEDSQCPGVFKAFSIIGQLSKLACLQIHSNYPAVKQSDSNSVISLSSLSNLKHLTALQLDKVVSFSGVGELQHVPVSIQKLQISFPACTRHALLNLDHLTALRSLSLHSSDCCCLRAEDSLPACLRNVRIGYCNEMQPLLWLTELQELSLTNTTDAQVAQVTTLAMLTKLALTYDSRFPEPYIKAWLDLAMLREVTLISGQLDPAGLKLIGETTGLTKLCMVFCIYEATMQELVLALKQLTNLQELVLDSGNPDPWKYSGTMCPPYSLDLPRTLTELSDEAHSTDAPSLLLECLTELANCYRLRSLYLDMGCGRPAKVRGGIRSLVSNCSSSCPELYSGKYAAVLARATALTRLSIGGEIMSRKVSTYVSMLTNLCSLRFVDNVGLSDTTLGLLAQSLTKLTHLDITTSTGGTTTAGLGVLTGLKQLRSLGVGSGVTRRMLRRLGLPTHCEYEDAWYGVPGRVHRFN